MNNLDYIMDFVRRQSTEYLIGCHFEINEWKRTGTITNGYLLDLQSRFNLNINQILGVGALIHEQLKLNGHLFLLFASVVNAWTLVE